MKLKIYSWYFPTVTQWILNNLPQNSLELTATAAWLRGDEFSPSRFLLAIKHFIIINFMNLEFECVDERLGRVVKSFSLRLLTFPRSLSPSPNKCDAMWWINSFESNSLLWLRQATRHHVHIRAAARRKINSIFRVYLTEFLPIVCSCVGWKRSLLFRMMNGKSCQLLDVSTRWAGEKRIELKIVSIKLEVNYCLRVRGHFCSASLSLESSLRRDGNEEICCFCCSMITGNLLRHNNTVWVLSDLKT